MYQNYDISLVIIVCKSFQKSSNIYENLRNIFHFFVTSLESHSFETTYIVNSTKKSWSSLLLPLWFLSSQWHVLERGRESILVIILNKSNLFQCLLCKTLLIQIINFRRILFVDFNQKPYFVTNILDEIL